MTKDWRQLISSLTALHELGRHCRLQIILSMLQEWHSLSLAGLALIMGIHRE
jgi:hypothetical protein